MTLVWALAAACSREQAAPAPAASAPAVAPVAATAPALPEVSARLGAPATVATGEPIPVTLEGVGTEGARWWITLVEASQPDTAWGRWQWVEPGTAQVRLDPAPEPGTWEVRLHAHHPARESHVAARALVRVVSRPS